MLRREISQLKLYAVVAGRARGGVIPSNIKKREKKIVKYLRPRTTRTTPLPYSSSLSSSPSCSREAPLVSVIYLPVSY